MIFSSTAEFWHVVEHDDCRLTFLFRCAVSRSTPQMSLDSVHAGVLSICMTSSGIVSFHHAAPVSWE
jgi:hypothetical protein